MSITIADDTAATAVRSSNDPWWVTQPAPVQAVITIAALDTVERKLIAQLAMPNHADLIEDIAHSLVGIDRCTHDDPREVCADYDHFRLRSIFPAERCDELSDLLQADVLRQAQLIAEMVLRGVAR